VTVNGKRLADGVFTLCARRLKLPGAVDGPALVEAEVNRIPPHSSDDDDRTYRTRQEVEGYEALGSAGAHPPGVGKRGY
jgi:hypothetical protein